MFMPQRQGSTCICCLYIRRGCSLQSCKHVNRRTLLYLTFARSLVVPFADKRYGLQRCRVKPGVEAVMYLLHHVTGMIHWRALATLWSSNCTHTVRKAQTSRVLRLNRDHSVSEIRSFWYQNVKMRSRLLLYWLAMVPV